jgi:hypothetical protein
MKEPNNTYQTDKQVEIERLEDSHPNNYRIVWGNPLTGEKEKEIEVNYLDINDYGIATSGMQLGQHNKSITIEEYNTSANIILED